MITRARHYKPMYLLIVLFGPLISSCGGGGGGGSNGISGVMNVTTFIVPAGETRVVGGDLTVISSGDIRIDGTLQLPAGANIVLASGTSLAINGAVTSATRSRSAGSKSTRDIAPEPKVIFAAPLCTVSGDTKIPPGSDYMYGGVKALGVEPRITITGKITCENGLDSDRRLKNGGIGGSIEIGTPKAIAAAQKALDASSFSFGTVTKAVSATISGSLTAGNGGKGFSDLTGASGGHALTLIGSEGGNGGSITVDATATDLTGSTIVAGTGGKGGSVGDPAKVARAQEGVALAEAGYDLNATSGNGGIGGSVILPAAGVTSALGVPGHGGSAGAIFVSAGNGGPGGRGGASTLLVGAKGKTGVGPGQPNGLSAPVDATVNLVSGSNGGSADSPSIKGGRGGDITVTARDGANRAVVVLSILIDHYGSGGAGSGGCGKPYTPGSAGGNGGTLNVKGAKYDATFSLTGGDGSKGCGAGGKGTGGYDDAGEKVGEDGFSKDPCAKCTDTASFDASGFYPLKTGTKYTVNYAFTGGGTYVSNVTVESPATVTGIGEPVVPLRYNDGGNGQVTAKDFENTVTRAATGVQIYGRDYYDNTGAVSLSVRYNPPFLIPDGLALNQPATQSIVESSTPKGGATTTRSYSRRVTLTGFETVTVGAGTYSSSARVFTEFLDAANKVTSSQTDWFAPGVGFVKNQDSAGNSQQVSSYTAGKSASIRTTTRR